MGCLISKFLRSTSFLQICEWVLGCVWGLKNVTYCTSQSSKRKFTSTCYSFLERLRSIAAKVHCKVRRFRNLCGCTMECRPTCRSIPRVSPLLSLVLLSLRDFLLPTVMPPFLPSSLPLPFGHPTPHLRQQSKGPFYGYLISNCDAHGCVYPLLLN